MSKKLEQTLLLADSTPKAIEIKEKVKEPRIVAFGFKNFKIDEKNDNKWQAECRTCKRVISEARGTTSGFGRYVVVCLIYNVCYHITCNSELSRHV